jgi:AcrR family transcriptional regulator
MPKVVDHAARRAHIVAVYLQLVAGRGATGATTRTLAEAAGISAGALWYYFRDMDAVRTAAAKSVAERTAARIAAASAGLRGLRRLRAILHELLPLDEETRVEAFVITGFWGDVATRTSTTDARSAAELWWDTEILGALREAQAAGETIAAVRPEAGLAVLRTLVAGRQVLEVLGGPDATPTAHEEAVETVLVAWTGRPAVP